MISHEYKTIHTALQNIFHLIFNDFLTNTHTHTQTLAHLVTAFLSLSCAEQTVDTETLQPLI